MNTERLTKGFEHAGYSPVQIDIDHIFIRYKADKLRRPDGSALEGKICAYVVLIWDFTHGVCPGIQEYQDVINRVKWNFYNMGFSSVELLSLLCTYEPEEWKTYCLDYDEHWIVCMDTGRLILFENQKGSFQDAEQIIREATAPEAVGSRPVCTMALIGMNAVLFLITAVTGGFGPGNMLRWGALSWPMVIENRQLFRLFTYMFLHFDIFHIVNNMFIFFFLGRLLEKNLSRIRYIVLYLGAGLFAGAVSMGYNMLLNSREVISAGASGAIFGVTGALAFIVLINKGKLENISTGSMLMFLFLTLYSGFTAQGVDNAAHVGGFIGGFLLGAALYRKTGKKKAGQMKI